MARHSKGIIWFGSSVVVAFILAVMMNFYGPALAVLVAGVVGLVMYMIGEAGPKVGERDHKA